MIDNNLGKLATLIRYYILRSTTEAGSGHPSSSLSAVELMAVLMFGGFFRFKKDDPSYHNNDRLIFSKGHASPLFYALWAAAGAIPDEELLSLRKLGSHLEGHPTMEFPYTEAPTGSLGQGLSIGMGMALNAKLDRLPYRTWVLLGDSEMAEGSVWEAIELASHYKLSNLVGILDVNRLGQRGPTMLEYDLDAYEKRIASFGWNTIVVDGHSIDGLTDVYTKVYTSQSDQPTMVIAKTLKGKGISAMENKDGWHGKALKPDEYERALAELGDIDYEIRGTIAEPESLSSRAPARNLHGSSPNEDPSTPLRFGRDDIIDYPPDKPVATRRAYGNALVRLANEYPHMVVLDAEVSNSTYTEFFKAAHPERFFEMYIAEQNMVGATLGLSRRGKKPCLSTFAAFLTRAHDQIRMCQYANPDMIVCGSHAGVSIGEDGASQMGLEDISLFRALLNSVVLYPSDAISCERLLEHALEYRGLVYIRTTRKDTPLLYTTDDQFRIGGSMTLREDATDQATLIAAGITLHEALAAHELLKHDGISVRVIDLYSVKPLDIEELEKAARETKLILTVEDHFPEGGIGEAVAAALSHTTTPVHSLAVRTMPHSGTPDELLAHAQINCDAIVRKIKNLLEH